MTKKTKKSPKLLPCPFCGWIEVYWSDPLECVECPNCAANSSGQGPHGYTKTEGTVAWNRRT